MADGTPARVELTLTISPVWGAELIDQPGFRDDVRARIRREVSAILRDLGLEESADVDVEIEIGEGPIGVGPLHLAVNGRPCRANLEHPPTRDPDRVVQRMVSELHRNRSRLIPDELLAKLWQEHCRTAAHSTSPPDGFRRLLERLVDDGYQVPDTLRRTRSSWEDCGSDPGECPGLEVALARLFPSSIRLHVGVDQFALWSDTSDGDGGDLATDTMPAQLEMMREGLFYELGVPFPPIDVALDPDLGDDQFQVELNRVRLPSGTGLRRGVFLVNDTTERLGLLGLVGEPTVNPANGSLSSLVHGDDECRVAEQAGLTSWDAKGCLLLALSSELRRHAVTYLTVTEVEYQLARCAGLLDLGGVVTSALTFWSAEEVTSILRLLIGEGVSIRDMRGILETMTLLRSPGACSVPAAVETLRAALTGQIVSRHLVNRNVLVVYLLADEIEVCLREAGSPDPLADEVRNSLLRAMHRHIGRLGVTAARPVVLTRNDIRRKLRDLIHPEFPSAAVLSYEELPRDLTIFPVDRISWI